MTDTDRSTLREAEQRRCQALLDNDLTALEAVLDDRLHYVHANGVVDGKASLLVPMREAQVRYLAANWDEQDIVVLGPNVGLIYGSLTARVRAYGVVHDVTLLVTGVWARDAEGWKLVGHQSTLPKAK